MDHEKLNEIFADAEEHLLNKSVLVGVAPDSMVGVRLHAEPYPDGIKCLVTVELSEAVDEDDDLIESISDAVSDHLKQNWDLNERMVALGLSAETVDWWPVQFEIV